MANRRLSVRKTKEILRLKHVCGLSEREIARSCNVARSTVADYLRRARAAGLTEAQLEARLFPTEHLPGSVHRPPPDCEYTYNRLRMYCNINLTLTQLWLEYNEQHPEGYQYTQFCKYYRRWRSRLDYCMCQEHRAGEKVFVDYCDGQEGHEGPGPPSKKLHSALARWVDLLPKKESSVNVRLGVGKGGRMVRKDYTPEQIINKLREAEVLLSQRATAGEVSRKIGVTEQTYYRWRKEYGGMRVEQAKRLKELVADLSLDNAILKHYSQLRNHSEGRG